jgi:cell division protein FtsI (penicillin-binding protein 3)
MAYGYEIKMTPLQMLAFYNSVANDGKMIAPIFVKEIRRLGNTIEQFKARTISDKICSATTLKKVKSLLEGVVTEGTGKNIIKNSLYTVAGKTGTAQIANRDSGYGAKKTYQASFCGYFPANHPKYAMIVVINHPTVGSYLAALVAGPVFREIADRVYSSDMDINQTKPLMYVNNVKAPLVKRGNWQAINTVSNKLGVKVGTPSNKDMEVEPDSVVNNADGVKPKKLKVPTVKGMGLSDALSVLGNAGYKVEAHGSGTVFRQMVNNEHIGSKVIIELQ